MKALLLAVLFLAACDAEELYRIRLPDAQFIGQTIDANLRPVISRQWIRIGTRNWDVTVGSCKTVVQRVAICEIPRQQILLAEGLPLLPVGAFIEPVIQGSRGTPDLDPSRIIVEGGWLCTENRREVRPLTVLECTEN